MTRQSCRTEIAIEDVDCAGGKIGGIKEITGTIVADSQAFVNGCRNRIIHFQDGVGSISTGFQPEMVPFSVAKMKRAGFPEKVRNLLHH